MVRNTRSAFNTHHINVGRKKQNQEETTTNLTLHYSKIICMSIQGILNCVIIDLLVFLPAIQKLITEPNSTTCFLTVIDEHFTKVTIFRLWIKIKNNHEKLHLRFLLQRGPCKGSVFHCTQHVVLVCKYWWYSL